MFKRIFVLFVIFGILIFINPTNAIDIPEGYVDEYILDVNDAVYNITGDIFSNGTAFILKGDNITLDAKNYSTGKIYNVSFSCAVSGNGILSSFGNSGLVLKHINFIQDNSTIANSHAISLINASSSTTLDYINVSVGGTSTFGVVGNPTTSLTISNSNISSNKYIGLFLVDSTDVFISNSIVYGTQFGSAAYLNTSDTINNNNYYVSDETFGLYFDLNSTNNTFYDSTIGNITMIDVGSSSLISNADGNIFNEDSSKTALGYTNGSYQLALAGSVENVTLTPTDVYMGFLVQSNINVNKTGLNFSDFTINSGLVDWTKIINSFDGFIYNLSNSSNLQTSISNNNLINFSKNLYSGGYVVVLGEEFLPPQSLTATPETTSVLLNWTEVPNADKYSIYELEEGIPWFDTQPALDGVIDDIYLELSHRFHINSPNPVNDDDFDVLYMGRDSNFVYLSGTAIDNDGQSLDDFARLYTDFTKNGLTTDDLMYQIRENGATSCYGWSGAAWAPCGSSGVTGTTTGAGTNLIAYELRVPVSELPANWVNGTNVRMLLEREDTSQNPNVFSYYPESNINNTDPTLWQDIKLSNTTEFKFLANTTNNFYGEGGLVPFSWYRFGVSAWNGSFETSLSIVNVTTLDTPKYNVSGYVLDLDSGLGVPSATVWIQNGFVLTTTSANSTGYYKLDNIHNGTYRVFGDESLYIQNNTTYFIVSGSDIINKNVTLEHLPLYRVSGYVYNVTGVGMSNATVAINGFTNITNSTGFYTVEGLVGGTYTGTATLNGFTSNEIAIIVFGGDVVNQNIILYVVEKLTSYIIYFILIISPTLIFVGNRMKIIGMLFVLTTYILFIFPGGWAPGELYVFGVGILFGFANIFNEDRLKYN